MNIILLDKVANLGGLGDQVSVKAGYARNFYSHRVKQFQQLKTTLKSLKLVVLN